MPRFSAREPACAFRKYVLFEHDIFCNYTGQMSGRWREREREGTRSRGLARGLARAQLVISSRSRKRALFRSFFFPVNLALFKRQTVLEYAKRSCERGHRDVVRSTAPFALFATWMYLRAHLDGSGELLLKTVVVWDFSYLDAKYFYEVQWLEHAWAVQWNGCLHPRHQNRSVGIMRTNPNWYNGCIVGRVAIRVCISLREEQFI